jgi:hypothetical protein
MHYTCSMQGLNTATCIFYFYACTCNWSYFALQGRPKNQYRTDPPFWKELLSFNPKSILRDEIHIQYRVQWEKLNLKICVFPNFHRVLRRDVNNSKHKGKAWQFIVELHMTILKIGERVALKHHMTTLKIGPRIDRSFCWNLAENPAAISTAVEAHRNDINHL